MRETHTKEQKMRQEIGVLSSRREQLEEQPPPKQQRLEAWKIFVVFCLFMVYTGYIMCSISLPLALPSMLDDKDTVGPSFNKEIAGRLLGISMFTHFIGKMLAGYFVDTVGGVTAVISVSVTLSFVTMAFGGTCYFFSANPGIVLVYNGVINISVLTFIWCLNRFFMAGMWCGMTSIMRNWFPEANYGLLFGGLSTFSRLSGVVGGYLLTKFLSWGLNWKALFLLSGIYDILLIVSTIVAVHIVRKTQLPLETKDEQNEPLDHQKQQQQQVTAISDNSQEPQDHENQFVVRQIPLPNEENVNAPTTVILDDEDIVGDNVHQVQPSSDENANSEHINEEHSQSHPLAQPRSSNDGDVPLVEHPLDSLTNYQAYKHFLTSPRVWVIIVLQVMYQVVFELNIFFPLYLKEVKDLREEGVAARAALMFALGSGTTVLFNGFLYDQLRDFRLGGFLFNISYAIIVCVCTFVLWIVPQLPLIATLLLLFVLGVSAAPSYYVTVGVFIVQYGGNKHVAKLSSIVDACAAVSAMSFDMLGGILAERLGWNAFWVVVFGSTVISFICTLVFQTVEELIRRRKKLDL